MSKNVKISIIVAVYNIENYIEQCIKSIVNQTCQNFELLLIDDGSTDKSGDICDIYVRKYKNVMCYHKENGGLSSTRNYGIRKSCGEYLMFIDGDDYLYDNRCIEEIVNKIEETQSDIIQYKMIYFYQNNKKFKYLPQIVEDEMNNYISFIEKNIKNGTLSVSACDKVVKASVIKENNIYFDENILSEDIDWSLNLYLYVKSICVVNKDIYVYRQQRIGSITNIRTKKSFDSLIFILDKWIKKDYSNIKVKKIYYNYLAYQYLILLTLVDENDLDGKQSELISEMQMLLKYSDNRKVKIANKVRDIFGHRFMVRTLKFYNYFRRIGVLKI